MFIGIQHLENPAQQEKNLTVCLKTVRYIKWKLLLRKISVALSQIPLRYWRALNQLKVLGGKEGGVNQYDTWKAVNLLIFSSISFAIPPQMVRVFGEDEGMEKYEFLMFFTGAVVIVFTMPVIKLFLKVKPINIMFYAFGFWYAWIYTKLQILFTLWINIYSR